MRLTPFLAAASLTLGGLLGASAAQARITDTVYFTPDYGSTSTYLVNWTSATRARVMDPVGSYRGDLSDDGSQRVVSFDSPPSSTVTLFPDSCGNPYTATRQVNQLVFRQVSGSPRAASSAIVEIGTETALDGCDAGTVLPFGSLTDAGFPVAHRAMNNRAPMTDVVDGVQLAGLVEAPSDPLVPFPAQDIASLLPGQQLRFEGTGTVVPGVLNADGWLVLSMPGFTRAYTRLVVDGATGAETWLESAWVNGKPATARELLLTKPLAGAGFGNTKAAAHVWESGLFLGANNPFFFWLYRDFTGERVSQTLSPPTETRQPITWAFDGLNIATTRTPADGTVRVRTWKPIANVGKNRWIMESETIRFPDGSVVDLILPRVNFYVDRGVATRPTSLAGTKATAERAMRAPLGRRQAALLPN